MNRSKNEMLRASRRGKNPVKDTVGFGPWVYDQRVVSLQGGFYADFVLNIRELGNSALKKKVLLWLSFPSEPIPIDVKKMKPKPLK
jgi:hypothetical protein